MSVLEETKYLMKKYKIKANKNLGQNFLIDDTVIEDIVNGANITKNDLVIEIGPGLGSMTALLVEKAKKVICIELDKKMIQILNDRFIAYNNIEIINEDVLKIDLNSLIEKEKKENEIQNVKIVANLPYYITTPIIMKLLEENLDIESITVMIQKEVADRLIEIPSGKNTGAITYTVFYYCEPEKIREVENTSFVPMPEVTSEVISLKLRKEPAVKVENKKVFFNIIKSAFMQRRKTLINALVNTGVFASKEEGAKLLKTLNLKEDIRAEKLTIEDFARISNYFCDNIKKDK
jgi:16S rRNA (adenine1518-N6/adenine1519-N6)-dimethyltransferase